MSGKRNTPYRPFIPSPGQNLLICFTANTWTNLLVFLTHLRIARQFLSGGPNFPPLRFLAIIMLRDDLSNRVLKEDGRLLVPRMHLAINKNATIEILLLIVAEHFIFSHDARVCFTDQFEVGIWRFCVSVDLVGHDGIVGASREELLNHDEMRPTHVSEWLFESLGWSHGLGTLTRWPWRSWESSKYSDNSSLLPAALRYKHSGAVYVLLWDRYPESRY